VRYIFLIILQLTFSLSVLSRDAEFILVEPKEGLKEGEVLEAVLRIWPVENNSGDELKKYLNQTLFGSFFLLDIESISPSINNADVIELRGTFAVSEKLDPEKLFVDFENEKIRVKYKEVLYFPHNKKPTHFEVLEQDLTGNYIKWIFLFITICIIFIVLYWKRNFMKSFFHKKIVEDEYRAIKELFLRASTRLEYEEIYKKRNLWMKKVVELTPAHTDFINIINEHQYKKEWSFFEKNEVEEAFSKIKRSLP
jgi:hypothetical protein